MSGVGRLPKYASEHKEEIPASHNWFGRLWWRQTNSMQKSAIPPRFLLVLLFLVQLFFLAIVRLGPVALPTSSSTSSSVLAHLFKVGRSPNSSSLSPPTVPAPTSDSTASSSVRFITNSIIPGDNREPIAVASSPTEEQRSGFAINGETDSPTESKESSDFILNSEDTHSRYEMHSDTESSSTIGSAVEASATVAFSANGVVLEHDAETSNTSQCKLGYIYVYDLPSIFNRDIIANCTALNPWKDVCHTLLNGGLGKSLEDASPLGQAGSWYASDQFSAEVVFHNRIMQYPCLTDSSELASAFYIPYYVGLDVGRYLWRGYTAKQRDGATEQLLDWLSQQESWKRRGGHDHFMMIGRITWDFRRSKNSDWGSEFFYKPMSRNITRLLIERSPWDEKEMGVPYPTTFHPQSDAHLVAWMDHIRNLERRNLFSFAGAPRKAFPNDFRGILLKQCQQSDRCESLDCSKSNGTCGGNNSLELFMTSTFCLQPRGDSFTRRSTFDCMLAGTIPVFFWERTAYSQYMWHLPRDGQSYSVFIPKEDVVNGTRIEDILMKISPAEVRLMQEAVIQLVPKIVYAVSGTSLKEHKDAFDLAIEGVMNRFKGLSTS